MKSECGSDAVALLAGGKPISQAECDKACDKAIAWLEKFMQGNSPDAAQARVVCGILYGLADELEGK